MALNPYITGYASLDNPVCGDGKCTVPYEDEVLCPQDCATTLDKTPWIVSAIVVLVIGMIYINYYRGKFNLRELTKGKMPFKSKEDLKNVVNFIENSLKNKNKQEIINLLLNQGWKTNQIKFGFEEVAWKRERKILNIRRNIPSKSEDVKPLKKYIKKCLSVRMPVERIKFNLLSKGWKKTTVEEAIKRYVKV